MRDTDRDTQRQTGSTSFEVVVEREINQEEAAGEGQVTLLRASGHVLCNTHIKQRSNPNEKPEQPDLLQERIVKRRGIGWHVAAVQIIQTARTRKRVDDVYSIVVQAATGRKK